MVRCSISGASVLLYGAHALVSQKNLRSPDKNIIGGAVVVRTSEHDIKKLSDLGSVAVAYSESTAFFVKAFLREFLLLDGSVNKRPVKLEKIKENEIELINSLIRKQHEAVLLPSGQLEQLMKIELGINNEVKIIVSALSNSSFDHTSTLLYPGWTLAAFPPADAVRTSLLTSRLLGMLEEGLQFGWTLAPNYETVHKLLEATQDKDYLALTKPSVFAFFKQYWIFFVFILFAIVGLIIHNLRTEFLIKKKNTGADSGFAGKRSHEKRSQCVYPTFVLFRANRHGRRNFLHACPRIKATARCYPQLRSRNYKASE